MISALKKPVKPAPKIAPVRISNPQALPAGIPKNPPILFANTQGKTLTATKTIPRVGDKKPHPPPKAKETVSFATYQRMLAKRNKYKWRLSVLENERAGRVRVPFCGLGKCPPVRPKAVVDKNIREVRASMNALNNSISHQKKTLADFAKKK